MNNKNRIGVLFHAWWNVKGKKISYASLRNDQEEIYNIAQDYPLEVTLQIIINYELERLILSYADSVPVTHPLSLAKDIKNRLEAALKKY